MSRKVHSKACEKCVADKTKSESNPFEPLASRIIKSKEQARVLLLGTRPRFDDHHVLYKEYDQRMQGLEVPIMKTGAD